MDLELENLGCYIELVWWFAGIINCDYFTKVNFGNYQNYYMFKYYTLLFKYI